MEDENGFKVYIPNGDLLPTFHSILLPDASRWDPVNEDWSYYLWGPEFDEWWARYVVNYGPGQEKNPLIYWADQGPGWDRPAIKSGVWEGLLK